MTERKARARATADSLREWQTERYGQKQIPLRGMTERKAKTRATADSLME